MFEYITTCKSCGYLQDTLKSSVWKKRKKLIIFGVIAVIIIIAIAIGSGGKDGDDGDKKKVENITSSDGAPAADDQTDAKGQAVVTVGQSVTGDELKISFISADADAKDLNKYSKPEEGNKVIRAEFKFENISDDDVILDGFECYADDKKCELFYGGKDFASPTLESVSAGRSFTAIVYYEVPKDAKTIELEYEDNIWTDEKTIFQVAK